MGKEGITVRQMDGQMYQRNGPCMAISDLGKRPCGAYLVWLVSKSKTGLGPELCMTLHEGLLMAV